MMLRAAALGASPFLRVRAAPLLPLLPLLLPPPPPLPPLRRPSLPPRAALSSSSGEAPRSGGIVDHPHKYIQPESRRLRTMHFQRSLPRLPVPPLAQSCGLYLRAVTPLIDDDPARLARTAEAVKAFEEREGPPLQSALLALNRRLRHSNYVSDFWFEYYLRSRTPIPIHSNPFLTLRDDPRCADAPMRAASLVPSFMRFMRSLRSGVLHPEVFYLRGQKYSPMAERLLGWTPQALASYASIGLCKAYPLDMSQYWRLFGTTRIPRRGLDELATCTDSQHIAVIRGGDIYRVDVIDDAGKSVPTRELLARFRAICAPRPAPGAPGAAAAATGARAHLPVGVHTSDMRDGAADTRAALLCDPVNARSLRTVDDALFVVCFDDAEPISKAAECEQFLFGDWRNRWFDKGFSLIITPRGTAAVNFEHSWGDGVAVLRCVNEAVKDAAEHPVFDNVRAPAVDPLPSAPLEWVIGPELDAHLRRADSRMEEDASRLRFCVANVDGTGKAAFKRAKLSPDGGAQMIWQLAYYKMYGKVVPTYESASTAAFKHGRTETIRPASIESKAMCRVFADAQSTREQRRAALAEAIDAFQKYMVLALSGKAMDRHLFVLRELALRRLKEDGAPLPQIFADPTYEYANQIHLSTSTLVSGAVKGGGFGPTFWKGYGIGYGLLDHEAHFYVSSFNKELPDFVECVKQGFADVDEALKTDYHDASSSTHISFS